MAETKLIHVAVLTDDVETIKKLKEQLTLLKEKLPDVEFLITNDKIQLRDIKYLIDDLYKLYQKQKKLKEAQKCQIEKE